MKIHYTIQLHSNWHCGSGLAAGSDVDLLVIKDSDGLPYIPGKTVKGLVREAVDELLALSEYKEWPEGYLATFGYFDDKDDKRKSDSFFGNATLKVSDAEEIKRNCLQKYLFTSIASTAIEKEGVAKEHSLRKMQVTLPCVLEGTIENVPEAMHKTIVKALGMIKNLGTGRTRGLGRCTWEEVQQ